MGRLGGEKGGEGMRGKERKGAWKRGDIQDVVRWGSGVGWERVVVVLVVLGWTGWVQSHMVLEGYYSEVVVLLNSRLFALQGKKEEGFSRI